MERTFQGQRQTVTRISERGPCQRMPSSTEEVKQGGERARVCFNRWSGRASRGLLWSKDFEGGRGLSAVGVRREHSRQGDSKTEALMAGTVSEGQTSSKKPRGPWEKLARGAWGHGRNEKKNMSVGSRGEGIHSR